jgi:competence protein ComEC
VRAYERVLPPEEATFLSGLTIGARGTLRDELKTAMQQSGTTHLVALSGYNITILAYVVMSILLLFSSRRVAFVIATLIIVCFVIMTGAEASVVRAAIVGFLVLVAREMGRGHSMRNIILCAGVMMVLLNPKILVFDVGFQLSFLALLGILYVRPALMMLFRISDASFLSWRDNLLTTLAAQLTTLPVLVINFGMFSPISLISNILILEFIPLTMALGFLTAFTSFISYHLSFILGLLTLIFLKIELWCIYTFARMSVPIEFKMSMVYVVLYFTCILLLVRWYYRKKKYDGRIV